MLHYPITLTPDTNGTLLVSFPDMPLANAVGEDLDGALANAGDALATAMEMLIDEGRPVPIPVKQEGTVQSVRLTALTAAKILLWNEMQSKRISKAELADRLHRPLADVDLLFDLGSPADVELIEKAAGALGKQVDICLG